MRVPQSTGKGMRMIQYHDPDSAALAMWYTAKKAKKYELSIIKACKMTVEKKTKEDKKISGAAGEGHVFTF